MTARTHQNRTQASQAKTRSGSRNNRTSPLASSSRQSSRGKRRKSEKAGKGARVIWMMVMVGGLIGSIFILAQRLQMNTLHLKRVEEGLKSEIDTLASQQPYLNFQKDKALSTQESQKVASEFNLVQPGVGRTVVHQPEPELKPASKVNPVVRPDSGKVTKAAAKHPASATQSGKMPKNAKVMLAAKIAKPDRTVKSPQAGKLKKDSKQVAKQVAKNQPSHKGARR
ncbi:MAG TPA: hypothetical protein PLK30_11680 [Blastocatellia bacterium]|nr:hypothetical protein [Blastocatellia bacterium]